MCGHGLVSSCKLLVAAQFAAVTDDTDMTSNLIVVTLVGCRPVIVCADIDTLFS